METAGAGDRETWLLETLVGMRVTVALGSRTPRRIQDLRGNDEGAARERRVMQKSPLRGGGRPGDVAVGDLGWYASDRCAGFPHATAHPRPSRERRGGGTGTSSYAKVSPTRGRATGRRGCWRPWLVCE